MPMKHTAGEASDADSMKAHLLQRLLGVILEKLTKNIVRSQ